jgi:hypothetical protein
MSRALTAAALGVLVVWIAALALGLGQAILGAAPSARSEALLVLPGVLVATALFAIAAWPRLVRAAPVWRPGTPVTGFERRSERAPPPPAPPPSAAAPPSPAPEPIPVPIPIPPAAPELAPALALVHLGPEADPAWAAWQLRWEAAGHGHGAIPLPFGARVVLGRDARADVVVRLDQISWHHLELDVRESEVLVTELGSTNGSRFEPLASASDAPPTPLTPRQPVRWTPRASLALASPTAITLTLEPLR